MKGTGADVIAVGDTITVKGTLKNYSGTKEFDSGCTLVSYVEHTVCEYSEATCTTPATCIICGATTGTTADHVYVNGKCECGAEQGVEYITASVNIGTYASANGWTDATKYTSLTIDNNITVSVSGTDQNTGKYYTNGNNWRMYQSGKPSIVISSTTGKKIVSVKITYASQNTGCLTLNGSNITSGAVVEVNASTITFSVGNTGSATNGQARITAIEVVYEA